MGVRIGRGWDGLGSTSALLEVVAIDVLSAGGWLGVGATVVEGDGVVNVVGETS